MANEQKTIISTKKSRATAEGQSALDFIVNEMIALKEDISVDIIKNLPIAYQLLLFGYFVKNNGKWDFKPILRKKISLYRHKTKISEISKRAAPVYATEIEGDDEYLYDYDIWSNIFYGYVGRMAGIPAWVLKIGSKGHDLLSGNGYGDKEDTAAVQLGIDLFDKYGDSLSKYQLEKALVKMMTERKDQFRKYQKNDLRIDGVRVRENDTLESIAEEMGVPLGAIMVKNPDIKDPNNLKVGTAIIIPSYDEVKAYINTTAEELKNSNGIKELQGDGDEVEPKPADKGASDDEVSAFSDVPVDLLDASNIIKEVWYEDAEDDLPSASQTSQETATTIYAPTEAPTTKTSRDVESVTSDAGDGNVAEMEAFLRMIQKDVSNEKNPIKRREGRDNLSKLYSLLYGDDEAEYEMGKVIQPKIKNTPAQLLAKIKKEAPSLTRNAYEVNKTQITEAPQEAIKNIAETMKQTALLKGKREAIKGLQSGLDALNKYSTDNPDPDKRPLKEDGIFGVKTNKALQKAIEEKGEEEVKKAYQMGQIAQTLKGSRKDSSATQKRKVEETYLNTFVNDERPEGIEIKEYIWRAINDDRTRSSHAARSGQRFSWGDPPEGGHPGQDYGCRCHAEPVVSEKESELTQAMYY